MGSGIQPVGMLFKGGETLLMDVLIASELPSIVVEYRIILIGPQSGTVLFSAVSPVGPQVDDYWILTTQRDDIFFERAFKSGTLILGLVEAFRWTGTEWETVDGYIGKQGNHIQFSEGSFEIPTYTGNSSFYEFGNYTCMKLLTSGTLNVRSEIQADLFLVGGGGRGANGPNVSAYGGGGGGGRYNFISGHLLEKNASIPVTIGQSAQTTSFSPFSAVSGSPGSGQNGGNSGQYGAGGRAATAGTNGIKAFEEQSEQTYCGGGGGGGYNSVPPGAGGQGGGGKGAGGPGIPPIVGQTNTGGGGGGGSTSNASGGANQGAIGGSGIVILRWLTVR